MKNNLEKIMNILNVQNSMKNRKKWENVKFYQKLNALTFVFCSPTQLCLYVF